MVNTKICIRCLEEKAVGHFYPRSGYNKPGDPKPTDTGHYLSECITCMNERSRTQIRVPKGESGIFSERLAMAQLRSNGIYVVKAHYSLFPDADLVCWGCIPVEVKFARLEYVGHKKLFKFMATPRQRKRGFVADLVMLIAEYKPGDETYHIFDANHPVFWMDGRVKSGFTFTPGNDRALKHGNNRTVMTQPLMDSAQDAYHLIEQRRLEIAQELKRM